MAETRQEHPDQIKQEWQALTPEDQAGVVRYLRRVLEEQRSVKRVMLGRRREAQRARCDRT